MFGNFKSADLIAYYCSTIDFQCRQELKNQILVSERDYVTAFSTRIRDDLRINRLVRCHAQTVRPRIENENGVDGIFVFKSNNEIKVGLFEAKRPQITITNYPWDYLSSRGISHFSEQIENQHKWFGAFAIWEMFLNEGDPGFNSPPFDYFGSSCIWHINAYESMNRLGLIFRPWTSKDLSIILDYCCTNIYSIIYDIISCKAGNRFKIDKNRKSVTVYSEIDKEIRMEIPLPMNLETEYDERIENFLTENRLDFYTFFDLDRFNIME